MPEHTANQKNNRAANSPIISRSMELEDSSEAVVIRQLEQNSAVFALSLQ